MSLEQLRTYKLKDSLLHWSQILIYVIYIEIIIGLRFLRKISHRIIVYLIQMIPYLPDNRFGLLISTVLWF